jgi:hypothetical protein
MEEEQPDKIVESDSTPSFEEMQIREELKTINIDILNPHEQVDPVSGFEIITESLVYKIEEIFGKNGLLSMLYQVGMGPGQKIAERIKEKLNQEEIGILLALKLLSNELKKFYSIQLKTVETDVDEVRLVIENHCFLRTPIKNRSKLDYGKAFCRVNKGYFETAFKHLVGDKIKKVEMKFLRNDEEKDVCVEEIVFYLNK